MEEEVRRLRAELAELESVAVATQTLDAPRRRARRVGAVLAIAGAVAALLAARDAHRTTMQQRASCRLERTRARETLAQREVDLRAAAPRAEHTRRVLDGIDEIQFATLSGPECCNAPSCGGKPW